MHNLVKQATGIDFYEYENNLDAAKKIAREILESRTESKDGHLIETCPSVGHVLNEVGPMFSVFTYTTKCLASLSSSFDHCTSWF